LSGRGRGVPGRGVRGRRAWAALGPVGVAIRTPDRAPDAWHPTAGTRRWAPERAGLLVGVRLGGGDRCRHGRGAGHAAGFLALRPVQLLLDGLLREADL